MIKYEKAQDVQERIEEIILRLGLPVPRERIICIRSKGSSSKRIIARCHALSRALQTALNTKAIYVIEVISEKFDKQNIKEQEKTLLHELLHIPKQAGGGFKGHRFVARNMKKLIHKLG